MLDCMSSLQRLEQMPAFLDHPRFLDLGDIFETGSVHWRKLPWPIAGCPAVVGLFISRYHQRRIALARNKRLPPTGAHVFLTGPRETAVFSHSSTLSWIPTSGRDPTQI